MWLADDRPRRLRWSCSACTAAREHAGAAFATVLEDKVALGLAEPPAEATAGAGDLVARAIAERLERARGEKMVVRSSEPGAPWADYAVTSSESGRSYRVALRSEERGDSYCACPDFRKNTLGTCKHILHVLEKVRRRFPAAVRARRRERAETSVHLRYGEQVELRVAAADELPRNAAAVLAPVVGKPITDVAALVRALGRLGGWATR
jgi:hypothetical protein